MASPATPTTSNTNTKEIAAEIPTCVRVYKDGSIERLRHHPFVPTSTDDPETGVSSKDVVISDNPSISARLFLPKSTQFNPCHKVPILVYFHGGGFFLESAFSQLYHGHFNKFVSQVDVVVVSVEYRLAPEHPLPACYHACWAALKWVASHFANDPPKTESWLINHGDFNRMFIGGDSAGGNIVHNVVMRVGSESLPGNVKILGAFCSHPYFYGSKPIGFETVTEQEKDIYFRAWNFAYPSAPGGIDNPMINPVGDGAPSLVGLGASKLLVCVAGKDKLRDRGVWYYEAVKKSGWQGELELYEEKEEVHCYHIHNPETENGKKFVQRLASFLLH